MRYIAGIPLAAILSFFGVVFSYLIGSLFDACMGTNALPIFLCAGIVMGLSASGNAFLKVEKFSGLIGLALACPIIAMAAMWIAHWLFPNNVAMFVEMIGYEGSIYALAFWGSAVMTAVRLVMALVVGLFVAIAAD